MGYPDAVKPRIYVETSVISYLAEGMDYLATWNFAHFANLSAKYRLVQALTQWGYQAPLFATPEELYESPTGALR